MSFDQAWHDGAAMSIDPRRRGMNGRHLAGGTRIRDLAIFDQQSPVWNGVCAGSIDQLTMLDHCHSSGSLHTDSPQDAGTIQTSSPSILIVRRQAEHRAYRSDVRMSVAGLCFTGAVVFEIGWIRRAGGWNVESASSEL